jgi:hypothetical protein
MRRRPLRGTALDLGCTPQLNPSTMSQKCWFFRASNVAWWMSESSRSPKGKKNRRHGSREIESSRLTRSSIVLRFSFAPENRLQRPLTQICMPNGVELHIGLIWAVAGQSGLSLLVSLERLGLTFSLAAYVFPTCS